MLPSEPDPDAVFEAFADWAADRGFTLYPAQEEALIEIVAVLVAAEVVRVSGSGDGRGSQPPA